MSLIIHVFCACFRKADFVVGFKVTNILTFVTFIFTEHNYK